MILFSIIIPVYNEEKNLERCIQSILKQKFWGYEIILIDDGSTDRSYNICNKYKEFDSRVKIFQQKNKGVCASRNIGLNYAVGEYVMFVDADDSLVNNCLVDLNNFIHKYNHPDIIEFLLNYYESDGTKSIQGTILDEGKYDKNYLANCFIPVHLDCVKDNAIFYNIFNVLRIVKRSLIVTNHIKFDESIRRWEDWLFAMQLFLKANEMVVLKKALYNYYAGIDDGLCKKYDSNTYKYIIQSYKTLERITRGQYNMFSAYSIKRKMEQFEYCLREIYYNENIKNRKKKIIEVFSNSYFQNVLLLGELQYGLFQLKPLIVEKKYEEAFLQLEVFFENDRL